MNSVPTPRVDLGSSTITAANPGTGGRQHADLKPIFALEDVSSNLLISGAAEAYRPRRARATREIVDVVGRPWQHRRSPATGRITEKPHKKFTRWQL
jgi:hypothetical protein